MLDDENFCDTIDVSTGVKGKKVIVQGFGNVGYHFANFCHKAGAKVVGIIERDGAIYNSSGFNPEEVKLFITGAGKNITKFPGAEKTEKFNPEKIMYEECDIFSPCAGDGTLNLNNAEKVNCKMIIEGANGPTTFGAD